MSCNPFAGLVESSSDISSQLVNANAVEAEHCDKINDVTEDIFYITINKEETIRKRKQLVYLEDLAENSSQAYFNLELLEQAVFERILLDNPEHYIVPKTDKPNSAACNKYVLRYLANCYSSLQNYNCDDSTKETIRNLIIRNFVLALKQPELFQGQDLTEQLVGILSEDFFPHEDFFGRIPLQIKSDDGSSLYEVFLPLLKHVLKDTARASLVNVDRHIYVCLDIFTCNEDYAGVLLEFCSPSNLEIGIGFSNTLLGALLTISILPKTFNSRYEYFDKPLDQTSSIIENNLWTSTSVLSGNLYRIFLRLLKCSKTIKNRTLNWLAQCLKANAGRGKIWNTHTIDFNPAQFSSVSDGFMINLADVILKLCLPFCSDISTGKIYKVDPTYCAVPDSDREAKEVHMFQLSTETCLIPTSTDGAENSTGSSNSRPIADSYNFVTECFFLAHRCLDLGYRVCVDQLVRMNQEIGQVQRAYNDAINQSVGASDVLDTIKQRLEDIMTKYRSLRAVLLAPELLASLSKFHRATATWLTQVCIDIRQHVDTTTYAPLRFRKVTFPLPETVPDTVKCIPEFVVENTVGFLSFLRRFHPQTLEEQGYEFLEPILTMVLVFMGSPNRMRNPHLRAKMAECLEALLPEHKDVPVEMNPLGKFQREKLFKVHPYRKEIVQNLLDVFVGIEMTGQSVQFEQKFNYRRPMYIVMDYLWQLDEHRNYFKQLAVNAEENMEAVSPPLFLRFINLLMNDAVFLLDESFSNMAQLRTMQAARESGEWDNLPQEERTQNLGYMQHIGMIARFDNILGRETIHTLELLTSEITIVFTHLTMVDRVAAMLNYFLYNLVGPNKKNFKVKDQKEYEFDPANTVMNICKIYVHLYESDAFCLAVSQDGRSYSPQLFSLAEVVLLRIGGGSLISELQQVASKVAKLASQHQAEEEILTEAPEEFLDPIMSTLMSDPVILPSSKQTVDRNTIARHLLSDQTDPFNRSPLTMDQVIPNTELLTKINAWISSRRQKSKH